jgi:hypothetical protein
VPPESIAEGTVRCPSGYVATGGSVSLGANDPVVDGVTANGRGWTGAAANFESFGQTYRFDVDVICARGTGVRVTTARVVTRATLKQEAREAARRAKR